MHEDGLPPLNTYEIVEKQRRAAREAQAEYDKAMGRPPVPITGHDCPTGESGECYCLQPGERVWLGCGHLLDACCDCAEG